jgi:hypothetical protein
LITDIFLRRYPAPWLREKVPEPLVLLVRQGALLFLDDVAPKFPCPARLFEVPEKRLSRELGVMALDRKPTPEQRVTAFLGEQYDLWNDRHHDPDTFIKLRLSLLELLFREAEEILRDYTPRDDLASRWALLQKRVTPPRSSEENALHATMTGIAELNQRFRDARMPFEYHNGLIQRIDDPLTSQEIHKPFWALVSDPSLANVDLDMKEALDRRDFGKPDAAFHALKALESVLKILSDNLGRTRGNEKGAADYIDNLVSSNHGRYIEAWEADALKSLFRNLRNPLGHGSGNAQPLTLSREQTMWALENAMSWIKSLLGRRP